jgi:DNA-binding NarL/FixJ family response regulator
VRVLLADDHTLFREGVAEIFAADEGFAVVGEAEDGFRAVELASEEKPDVVLLDVEMPGPGAEETVGLILEASPLTKVVVLTMHDEPALVRDLLGSGAHAYIVKSATREELLSAVRTVDRDPDRVVLSVSRTTLERIEGRHQEVLSARELEVLSLAARGLGNARIAKRLYISEGTVKRHLTNAYAKLGVASRVDAVNKAVAMGPRPQVAPREGLRARAPGPEHLFQPGDAVAVEAADPLEGRPLVAPEIGAELAGREPLAGQEDDPRPPRLTGGDLAAGDRPLQDAVLVGVQHLHPLERSHQHLLGIGKAIVQRT